MLPELLQLSRERGSTNANPELIPGSVTSEAALLAKTERPSSTICQDGAQDANNPPARG